MNHVVVIYGDGIGPEIMHAVLKILKAAKSEIQISVIEMGERLYKQGYQSGMRTESWDAIVKSDAILKAPITTPQGEGYKSINVTLRRALGLYANIRPIKSYSPFVKSTHSNIDLVIFRENEEDLYIGVEYQHNHNIFESSKLISKTSSYKIINHAFEYAKQHGRKKVSCFTKDNIMKMTDGAFHKIFNKIATHYPEIASEHQIIDIATARIAVSPEKFDVIVTMNLYGDIISDVAAEVSGSLGLAGSANIGDKHAMFEAVHGSAPDIAGNNIANPSGLLNSAIMMLNYMGQNECAFLIESAWKKTIEEGFHTKDIYNPNISKFLVGTEEFADKVIERLKYSSIIKTGANIMQPFVETENPIEVKAIVGVDIYISHEAYNSLEIYNLLKLDNANFDIQYISVKGLAIWEAKSEHKDFYSDYWTIRILFTQYEQIIALLNHFVSHSVDVVKIQTLYSFNGINGFTIPQGANA